MAGFDQILYVGLVGGGLYLAYTTGLLDQAGQAIVTATQPKQASGWSKCGPGMEEILASPETCSVPGMPCKTICVPKSYLPKGWGKGKKKKVIEILEQPLMVPSHPKRIRMTIA